MEPFRLLFELTGLHGFLCNFPIRFAVMILTVLIFGGIAWLRMWLRGSAATELDRFGNLAVDAVHLWHWDVSLSESVRCEVWLQAAPSGKKRDLPTPILRGPRIVDPD